MKKIILCLSILSIGVGVNLHKTETIAAALDQKTDPIWPPTSISLD
ncbi:hypothetical protein [Rossellomorea sp. NS-SX7]